MSLHHLCGFNFCTRAYQLRSLPDDEWSILSKTDATVVKREVISIHIGQCGVQLGNACWELFGVEHGILPNGYIETILPVTPLADSFTTFYNEARTYKYVPRAILVDFEPTVIEELRRNQYGELFRPESMINGKEDAANIYGRGYYTVGKEMETEVIDQIRKEANLCQNVGGFFIFHSMGGGTGSGFTSLLLHKLSEEYPKKNKLEFIIYPCPRLSTGVVEPYNAVLMCHNTMETTDCAFLMDNEALYDICHRHLDMEKPTYVHLNRIFSQVTSSLTAPMRFDGPINVEFSEFQTNLVPYPRIHYPLVAYAPFNSWTRAAHKKDSVSVLTEMVFRRHNQMLKCDPTRGKYMACCMLYRGLVPINDVNTSIHMIRHSKLSFVDWCPTGFKVGCTYQPSSSVPGSGIAVGDISLCAITNSTSIAEVWSRINYKFDLMYSKRAFAHWFLSEGMDEQEFIDAREDLASLEKDYEECGRESDFTHDSNDEGSASTTLTSNSSTSTTEEPAEELHNDESTATPAEGDALVHEE